MSNLKKIAGVTVAVVLVLALGLFFWARSVLTGDRVRLAVAEQLSKSLGQPVSIGGLGVTIFPRVTMTLDDVAIGQPAKITAKQLYVGTDLRALLSKRIEHAVIRLAGARVQLPLPPLGPSAPAGAPAATDSGQSPVEIVSVDDIALTDAEIVSGKRTVRADVDLVASGSSIEIKSATIKADKTTLTLTGRITNLAGPVGDLKLTGQGLDFVALQEFATEFTHGSGLTGGAASPAQSRQAPATPMDLTLSITADRATFGALELDKLDGTARITPAGVRLEPARFQVFGGSYAGEVLLTLGDVPQFRIQAALTGIEVAKVMTFAGKAGAMTGKMSGKLDVNGRGMTAQSVLGSARGSAQVGVTDGTVKGLGLLRAVVLATSMRPNAGTQARQSASDEAFSKLGGSFAVADGAASSKDLRFESTDLLVSAVAVVRLDGSSVDVTGPVQLSDQLTQQAGRDLVKLTQKDGRVTIPASISGPVDHLHVKVDVGDMAKRAITNTAADELLKALQKKIGRGGD